MKARYIYYATAGIIVLWIANWWYVSSSYCTPAVQGQFGDMFGAVNALFSGLTVVGLISTLLLQRDEIRISRGVFEQQRIDIGISREALKISNDALNVSNEELKLTREELKLTREELSSQNRTLKYQRDDTTFFNLLKLHLETAHGFARVLDDAVTESRGPLSRCSSKEELFKVYRTQLQKTLLNSLSQYFRSFETVVEWIVETKTGKKGIGRKKYLKLFFAQVSIKEKILLSYYFNFGWTTARHKYFDSFAEELFADIPFSQVGHHIHLMDGVNMIIRPN